LAATFEAHASEGPHLCLALTFGSYFTHQSQCYSGKPRLFGQCLGSASQPLLRGPLSNNCSGQCSWRSGSDAGDCLTSLHLKPAETTFHFHHFTVI
jgi:hypothetical protein